MFTVEGSGSRGDRAVHSASKTGQKVLRVPICGKLVPTTTKRDLGK